MSYVLEADEAELMVVITEGGVKEIWGAGGHDGAVLTIEEAKEKIAEAQRNGLVGELFVVWGSNADGYIQVEARDPEEVEAEINDDLDEEEE